MAGHSKWANIKHKKERADKKRGKIFSRFAKEIISAVKEGKSPDPKSNPRLRLAIQKAKAANVPNDNIERNIKKASSSDQGSYVEVTYELYGHGGVGIIVEAMTDNKNRTASEMRIATNKCGGSIAAPGSVAFNFDRQGIIRVLRKDIEEDKLFEVATEHGALDFEVTEEMYIIITSPDELYKVKEGIDFLNLSTVEVELEMVPKVIAECSDEHIESNMKLIDWLENLEDVDAVFHNMAHE